jgi:DnaJ-class molecular chaperone
MVADYYVVLGVARNATTQQIREQFRKLVRDRHPDRFRGAKKERAEREFQDITQAFNILVNPEARRQHDRDLAGYVGNEYGSHRNEAARVYIQRGIKAFKQDRLLQAAENFNRATREDPESARAWYLLARACQSEERWRGKAVTAVQKACELEPMNAEYHTLAGHILTQANEFEQALEAYRTALDWGGDEEALQAEIARLEKRLRSSRGRRSRGRS